VSYELQLDRSFIALVFDFLGWPVPFLSTPAARLEYGGLALSWNYISSSPLPLRPWTLDLQASSLVEIA